MAKGEFVWILEIRFNCLKFLKSLEKLFSKKNEVDSLFCKFFNLQSFKVLDLLSPLIQKICQTIWKNSKIDKNQIINFLDLINPKFSFDFCLVYISRYLEKKNGI